MADDKTEFELSEEAFREFEWRTLQPPKDLPKLRDLLQRPSTFTIEEEDVD